MGKPPPAPQKPLHALRISNKILLEIVKAFRNFRFEKPKENKGFSNSGPKKIKKPTENKGFSSSGPKKI